jgi:ribosomal protein S5
VVTTSTPRSRPVVVACGLRKGSAGSGKGAASLVAEAVRALREAGVTAMILVQVR